MLFAKYSGAENLFLIALARSEDNLRGSQVIKICQTYGVDGALLVKKKNSQEFFWDFFNADGSTAEMCGNAARCVLHYLLKQKQIDTNCILETLAGPVSLFKAVDGSLKVGFSLPTEPMEKSLLVNGKNYVGSYIIAGVPHLILSHPDALLLSKEQCRSFRNHPDLQPRGANITLVQELAKDQAIAKTYERGVEDFTKACGTGAVAAAHFLRSKHEFKKAEIQMPGGTLFVEFSPNQVLLSGPTVFDMELEIDLSQI